MFRRLIVLTASLLAVGVMASAAAAEGASDRLVYDSGPLGGGARDMLGADAGWVTSYMRQSGDMQVNIAIRGGDASTSYNIFFQCGPTHVNPGFGFFTGSSVTTGPTGRANVSFTVPASSLALCGGASGTGHLDLESGFSSLTVTGIEWTSS
jgi:hypothetical protein